MFLFLTHLSQTWEVQTLSSSWLSVDLSNNLCQWATKSHFDTLFDSKKLTILHIRAAWCLFTLTINTSIDVIKLLIIEHFRAYLAVRNSHLTPSSCDRRCFGMNFAVHGRKIENRCTCWDSILSLGKFLEILWLVIIGSNFCSVAIKKVQVPSDPSFLPFWHKFISSSRLTFGSSSFNPRMFSIENLLHCFDLIDLSSSLILSQLISHLTEASLIVCPFFLSRLQHLILSTSVHEMLF